MDQHSRNVEEVEGTRLLDLLRCYDIWSATPAERMCGCATSWEEARCGNSSAT